MSYTVACCLPVASQHHACVGSGLGGVAGAAPYAVVEMHFSAQPSQAVCPLQRAARAQKKPRLLGVAVSNAYLGCSCVLRGSLESLLCSNLAKYYQTCRQISISTLGGCRLCRATVLRAATTNLKLGAVVEWAWMYFSRCCTWPAFEAADEKERC
jgi:hypothetical protein